MIHASRSLHFVPGANEKMLAKALASEADALILDLEDAVTPDNKASARATIASWLADPRVRRKPILVRINATDTDWWRADLEATHAAAPDAYLVPKVCSAAEVTDLDQTLAKLEQAAPIPLFLIGGETPAGVLSLPQLPCVDRVQGLTWGAEDLAAALGARRNRDNHGQWLPPFEQARTMTLLAAGAAGIAPIDTVYTDFGDDAGLRVDSDLAADMGFTGKLTIHPAQIPIVNEVFTPDDAEINEARELVQAFEENERAGRMAFQFRGQMVDVPHLRRAQRVLARAEALEDRPGN